MLHPRARANRRAVSSVMLSFVPLSNSEMRDWGTPAACASALCESPSCSRRWRIRCPKDISTLLSGMNYLNIIIANTKISNKLAIFLVKFYPILI
jgi:hypothetical protein